MKTKARKNEEIIKLMKCEGEIWDFLQEFDSNPLFFLFNDGIDQYINYKECSTYNKEDAELARLGLYDSFNKLLKLIRDRGIDTKSMMANREYSAELIDMWVALPNALNQYACEKSTMDRYIKMYNKEMLLAVKMYLSFIIDEMEVIERKAIIKANKLIG